MDLLATILVDGLIYAGWLFIVSVGLTLVFGVLNILNLAHGSLYAIGAYAASTVSGAYRRCWWPSSSAPCLNASCCAISTAATKC